MNYANHLQIGSNCLFLVRSFVEMSRAILREADPGEHAFMLSEHVSQDPLENYFGQQRGKGGRCDNPSLKEVLTNASSIRLQVRFVSSSVHL